MSEPVCPDCSATSEDRLRLVQQAAGREGVVLRLAAAMLVANAPLACCALGGAVTEAIRVARRLFRPLDVQTVGAVVAELVRASTVVTPDAILKVVSEWYGVPVEVLRSTRRDTPTIRAKHAAIYLMRTAAGVSSPRCARIMRLADHSTILYAQAAFGARLEHEPQLRRDLATLTKRAMGGRR